MFLFSSCAANSWRVELCSVAVMESQQHTEEVLHTHPEHLKENNVKCLLQTVKTDRKSQSYIFCGGGYDDSPEVQRTRSCFCLNLLVKLDCFAPLHSMTSEIQNERGHATYIEV